MYSFFFLFIYLSIFTNNSYAANNNISNQGSAYIQKLPPELKTKILHCIIENNDISTLQAMIYVNKNFYSIIKNNIKLFLPLIDRSIEFEYYFTQNAGGSFHRQNYYKFPLNTINTQKMLFIISYIKKLYTNDDSKTARQIAQDLKCFQYIVFHEEYCFRSMIPPTRCTWRENYKYFIHETCQHYIGFFDPYYVLEEDFFNHDNTPEWKENKKQWVIKKIQNNNNNNALNINTNEEVWWGNSHIPINFPCSLLNVIITFGNHCPMSPMEQDENFETYVKKLFNDDEKNLTKIDITHFEKTENLLEQTSIEIDVNNQQSTSAIDNQPETKTPQEPQDLKQVAKPSFNFEKTENLPEQTSIEIDVNNQQSTSAIDNQPETKTPQEPQDLKQVTKPSFNKIFYKNRFIQFLCKKIVMFLLLIKKFFSILLIF